MDFLFSLDSEKKAKNIPKGKKLKSKTTNFGTSH